jgi:hypothetical protein
VKGLNPLDESGVELPGIEQLEDAAQGILHAARSETSSNRWKLSVISVST